MAGSDRHLPGASRWARWLLNPTPKCDLYTQYSDGDLLHDSLNRLEGQGHVPLGEKLLGAAW
jgi:hypothetical protein